VFLHRGAFNVVAEFLNKDYSNQDLPKWLQTADYEGKVVNEDNKIVFISGIWKSGTWRTGRWRMGSWLNGIWEWGTWMDGTWYDGTWKDGTWYDGTWKGGVWKDGTWYDGTWLKGLWKHGMWFNGTWQDGTWQKGIWYEGDWKNGTWEHGLIYDQFKKGNRNSDQVTTALENSYLIKKILDDAGIFYTENELHEYVFSKVDPKEYFDESAIYKTLKNQFYAGQ